MNYLDYQAHKVNIARDKLSLQPRTVMFVLSSSAILQQKANAFKRQTSF